MSALVESPKQEMLHEPLNLTDLLIVIDRLMQKNIFRE